KDAFIDTSISSNHGREEYVPVWLDGDFAVPIAIKSGLISKLRGSDGYIIIDRESEGLQKGQNVKVKMW
ncbi:MAG: hypothetical protein MJ189_03120, partial [Coriobacteriales bacterium]|nr:hypothetical protein [Coriobacteriales bacterium]